jgi:hypothetical protein
MQSSRRILDGKSFGEVHVIAHHSDFDVANVSRPIVNNAIDRWMMNSVGEGNIIDRETRARRIFTRLMAGVRA